LINLYIAHARIVVCPVQIAMHNIGRIYTAEKQRVSSAAHVYLGWLTDGAMHRIPQNRRGCTISDT